MNILLTTISLSSISGGGTAERTRRLARHLTLLGHHCSLATMEEGDLAKELRGYAMSVYVAPVITVKFRVPLINLFKLAKAVRAADAIHILGYWNLLSVSTAAMASYFNKPYVFSAAGEFVGLEKPRPIARAFHFLLGTRMLKGASLFAAVTELERQQIEERFKFAQGRVIVIPNGVELEPSAGVPTIVLPQCRFILFMGRLADVKGPDLLLAAFVSICTNYPDIMLVIAGPDFGMKATLLARVADLQLEDRVVFTGHLDESNRTEAYRRATILAVPSRAEAMSLVAVEAAALGTPVLITDRCGFDEIATHGGAVVPATVEGLRRGLNSMLEKSEGLPALGERLRSFVGANYSWPAIAGSLIGHLERVTSETPKAIRSLHSRSIPRHTSKD